MTRRKLCGLLTRGKSTIDAGLANSKNPARSRVGSPATSIQGRRACDPGGTLPFSLESLEPLLFLWDYWSTRCRVKSRAGRPPTLGGNMHIKRLLAWHRKHRTVEMSPPTNQPAGLR
jgi:hypothetical protein